MTSLTKIAGGTVYDPANGVDGEVRDIWIDGRQDRRRRRPTPTVRPRETIDATRAGRDARRRGHALPHRRARGQRRAADHARAAPRRGERPAAHRAHPQRHARHGPQHVRHRLQVRRPRLHHRVRRRRRRRSARGTPTTSSPTRPCIDKGYLRPRWATTTTRCERIERGDRERLRMFLAWLLGATRGYALKLVNPGGVEAWKQSPAARGHGLDDAVPGFDVTPRPIIREIVAAANDLGLPHPAHIHCNQLGMPGNWRTTLDTMRGRRGPPRPLHPHPVPQLRRRRGGRVLACRAASRELADYVNAHPNLTVDVGQVMFGDDDGDDRRRRRRLLPAQALRRPRGSTATSSAKPAAASCRSSTAARASSTPCSGRSAWSGICSSTTRGR